MPQHRDIFSYEHFYVIYTSFWKLDTDHDLMVNRAELAGYGNDGLSEKAIDRIFADTVLHPWSPPGKMSYNDFVWFILAEEASVIAFFIVLFASLLSSLLFGQKNGLFIVCLRCVTLKPDGFVVPLSE